jgi:hypothetical protein
MRAQRVYPVVVRWGKSRHTDHHSHPVDVRLIGGGAQIVPSEHTLDPAKPDRTATFYLTPLAQGWLRGVRVEVIHQGRKVQEIPLASKTVSQRGTFILLLLTFLVPWFLLWAFKYNAPTVLEKQKFQTDKGIVVLEVKSNKLPGEAIQRGLDENIPPAPDMLYENLFPTFQFLTSLTSYIGMFYDLIYTKINMENVPLAYYAFWILLFLTACSFLFSLEKRKRKVARAIELPAATPPAPVRHAEAAVAEPGA